MEILNASDQESPTRTRDLRQAPRIRPNVGCLAAGQAGPDGPGRVLTLRARDLSRD
jgi:hypothetical protein